MELHEIGAATRQRPTPRHQEQESMMQSKATSKTDMERALWAAWSAAEDAAREAGALSDTEEGDHVTYLMVVEARDLIAKAMRREGFRD